MGLTPREGSIPSSGTNSLRKLIGDDDLNAWVDAVAVVIVPEIVAGRFGEPSIYGFRNREI